jgi:hypothetical protein
MVHLTTTETLFHVSEFLKFRKFNGEIIYLGSKSLNTVTFKQYKQITVTSDTAHLILHKTQIQGQNPAVHQTESCYYVSLRIKYHKLPVSNQCSLRMG